MSRLNVLVTGVGAVIGYGIIDSLRKTNRDLHIIGMDIYDDAVGQYFCDTFIRAKRADSPEFINFLLDIVNRHRIDLVFFGTEPEIHKVSDSRDSLRDIAGRLVLNDRGIIDASRDKFKTYSYLCDHGIDAIASRIDGTFDSLASELGSPFLLKLRCSTGSKGMFKINDQIDYDYWRRKSGDDFMVQEIVGDDDHEYTVALFGFGNGKGLKPFILRRKLNREGSTAKAVVDNIPAIAAEVERLTRIFQPVGPTNYQFRFHQGKYLLLEVNPRISSSISIRTAFGYNEAELCIQYYVEHRDMKSPSVRGGNAVRYFSDWINYENRTDI